MEPAMRSHSQPPEKMRILVAMDESDTSFYALQWAIDHFGSLVVSTEAADGGGMLTVVHIQQPFHYYFAYPAGPGGAAAIYASSSMRETIRQAQQENSAALLARALELCRGTKIKMETLILEGDPKDMICQAAEDMHVDLLVMGSRGLGKIKRAFLGSVSDYCAHHAVCPILIVKPPKETEK